MRLKWRSLLTAVALALGMVSFQGALHSRTASAGALLPSGQLWTYSATIATGTPITVVNLTNDTQMAQFDPRGQNGRGIAFDTRDGNIWDTVVGGSFSGDGLIHKNPPLGGPDILTIPDPGGVGGPGIGALDFDPEENVLWASSYKPDGSGKIKYYKLDPATGTVLHTCAYPKQGGGVGNDTMAIARPADLGGTKVILTDAGETAPLPLVAIDVNSCAVLKSYTLPLLTAAKDFSSGVSGIVVDRATGDLIGTNPMNGLFYNFGPAPYASVVSTIASTVTNMEDVTLGDLLIKAKGINLSSVEGAPFSGAVATFTDQDPQALASDYSATIDWGDTTSSAGAISGPIGGPFSVSASHTYRQEGSYTVKTTITDVGNADNSASVSSTATVGDAALAASCAVKTAPASFNGPTAILTDANSFGLASDFTATINWGDTTTTAGTVTGPVGGSFAVSGTHSYASTGAFTITTAVVDDGGSTASAACPVLIFAIPATGGFVIGNGNAQVGSSVTFWGAQWHKRNTLSGGPAPAAFKGFEDTPPTVACGVTWSTDPGNSTPPPVGPLPAFMAVIVSSSVSQSGSTISGNTVHIVIVKTNPGYQPNPGHAGTGTVVAVVC